MVAMKRNQLASIRSRGRLMLDMKMATKKSGNALSTASTDPVLSARIAPIPPNPRATSTVRNTITTIPKKPERHDPREHPEEERHRTHRGELEPVEEAALDVAGEVGARRDRTEERCLDEGESEGKVHIRVGREAGDTGGGVEPIGVDGEEHHREEQRRDYDRRLAHRPKHGALRDRRDLGG